MPYSVPLCECGARLIYCEEHTMDVWKHINKNGTPSRRSVRGPAHSNGIVVLQCSKCKNWYQVDYDERDRIVRGDRFN